MGRFHDLTSSISLDCLMIVKWHVDFITDLCWLLCFLSNYCSLDGDINTINHMVRALFKWLRCATMLYLLCGHIIVFFFSLKPIVHRILLIKYNETILCYNWVDIAMKLITQIKLSWLLPCLLLHCRHYVSCTLPFSWLQLQQSMWISTYFWCWRGPVNGMSTPVNNSMLLYVTRIAIVIT